jgi:hypothetical protein
VIVAIHQPNYAPWLGYFRKIAMSDHFIFLDDAAFSRGSVTNRVRILENGKPAWLTVPAKPSLGTEIRNVDLGQTDWRERHLSRLHNCYSNARAFGDVWQDIEVLFHGIPDGPLADTNRYLIESLARQTGVQATFHTASAVFNEGELTADDRLIALIRSIPKATTYLSGSGGRKYQDEGKFHAEGLVLKYSDYEPVSYPQTENGFTPGLSVLDAVFNMGWDGIASLLDVEESHV